MTTLPTQLQHDLQALAGEGGYRDATERDVTEMRGRYRGGSTLVLRPKTTEIAAAIVSRCAEAQLPIIPIGGATGLVAGHIASENQTGVLLSTERLVNIREINSTDRQLVAEAGVILANVQAAATAKDLLFPLSLAAEGSCTIGGNLSTNAGGVQVLRYGNTRDLVLGVEAIMPNGEILNGLSPLRKNNTGYDIKNLLIGAEGTLGLITAASLKLYPSIKDSCTALCPVASPAAALALLSQLQHELGEFISAFELISGQGLHFLREHFPQLPQAISPPPEWSVVLELGSSAENELKKLAESALTKAIQKDLILDAVISQSETQRQQIWSLREHIPLANKKVGAIVSFDISLPLSKLALFIKTAVPKVQDFDGNLRINCFGHVGDGNLHFNVFPPIDKLACNYRSQQTEIRSAVYDLVQKMGGSFSAEHGVGRDKVSELLQYGDPTKLEVMASIKKALDPNGIFNPGAVIDPRK